jgi:superfamily II DNA or RNA helicase/tetratricopeptide (TPR) repeat protein
MSSREEHRKQVLKQRRAEAQKEADLREAKLLYLDACRAHHWGDMPAAGRLLQKVLLLDPNHVDALTMLAEIHVNAGHHAEALGYFQRVRKLNGEPLALYNIAVLYRDLGQPENGVKAMREFLEETKSRRDARLQRLRASAEGFCATYQPRPAVEKRTAPPPPPGPPAGSRPAGPPPPAVKPGQAPETQPAPPAPKSAPTPAAHPASATAKPPSPASESEPRAPKPEQGPEPPRVSLRFLPAAAPRFESPATVADYFLRRRWIALRLEQNFEDLLCLPSLQGVDAYMYQQETVRKVLRHFKGRALLADEVGLGKTIEACMVLKEYWMRGLVRKALVLTPPSLVSQWKGELIEKFGLVPVSPDTAEFRRNAAQFWKDEALVVASIAMARLDPHAGAIAAASWDMVIVDEAHCLKNRTSANWRLVDSLQKKFILMLTATPVENNLIELYNLITLLKPGLLATEADFRKTYMTAAKPKAPKNADQLRAMLGDVMIRNTRAAADVQLPRRIAATVSVPPSEAEAQVYKLVSGFVGGRYKQAHTHHAPAMVLDLMQRQAGSSPMALRHSVARALREETWVRASDRRELEAILELVSGLGESGKAIQLGRMLAAHAGKAVVFTEFIPTLDYLSRVCDAHGISYSLFSGDLSRAEKDAAIAQFRDHSRVLLSTGAGGEGRNLQFADTVINFDLPWNPMRIEQRVGRVHRIGQTHDVFVFNFCQEGTVEEQLLRVLHDKINMFELVVGEMDAILGALEDSRDFAEIVMDLWISGQESGQVEQGFEELARRLLDAKKQHLQVQELDESLFAHDFEV